MKIFTFPKIMAFLTIILCSTVTLQAQDLLTLGEPSQGTLPIDGDKTYNINVLEGKTYKATVEYTATGETCGFIYLDMDDWDDGLSYDDCGSGSVTITVYSFVITETGTMRIVLTGSESKALDYELIVEEHVGPINYTELDYPALPAEGSSGTLQSNILDSYGDVFSGKGYSIDVEEGKTYKITVRYTASEPVETIVAFSLFAEDNMDDAIGGSHDYMDGTEFTIVGTYEAAEDGIIRILLGDLENNLLGYTIIVKEIGEPISLAELLDKTEKSIEYKSELSFSTGGELTDLVIGNDDVEPYFRETDGKYFAVSYKIELQEDDHIKIRSSRPNGDSYLYIYKATADGYSLVLENDDCRHVDEYYDSDACDDDSWADSYLELTAEENGIYYIVVTDYWEFSAGDYRLKVWNTEEEPDFVTPTIPQAPVIAQNIRLLNGSGSFQIQGITKPETVRMFSMNGKVLMNRTVHPNESVSVAHLPKGVYLVNVNGKTFRLAR
ncbi:MAG: T9SS type A sorting domain-containing protein [Fibromonadaceae bacterium]|jgi:hypothetical protein|nr:T9SS type A sorting domain-containing protein [Fibromonadaceae bacterium]